MKKRRGQCAQICLLLGGVLLITLGLSIFLYLEPIYDFMLNDALKITPTSKAFTAWRVNDPPLDMDIYIFNWTNPEEIKIKGTKPKFEEVGPYRFKEVKEKVNIQWNDNHTITYNHRKLYFYDEEGSARKLDDVITTINAVPLTVAYQARYFGLFAKRFISYSLSSLSSLYVRKTAGQLLFEGYEDGILSVLSRFPMLNVADKFGMFYQKNNTAGQDGIFSMSTKNDENFGKLLSWNYKNHSNFYDGKCNDIKGSAGEFYPINRKRDRLVLYSSELCKYAELEYEKDIISKGVHGYKFSADNMFDNGTNRPENACFCPGECLASGVLNVSSCRQNSPTFLSLPHFYGADAQYVNQIEGMKPQRDLHEFYINIEPKSGIVMDIKPCMQVNLLLQPISSFSLYYDVPKVLIPVFYFTQTIELKDDLASNLRLIQNIPEYLTYCSLIFALLGCVLIIWGICTIWWCAVASKKQSQTKNTHQHEELPLNEKL